MSYRSICRAGLFEDKVVIVTGGGSGIGRRTAHELASLGAVPALIGHTRAKLDGVCAEIAQAGGSASAHVCDIRSEEAVTSVVAEVLAGTWQAAGRTGSARVRWTGVARPKKPLWQSLGPRPRRNGRDCDFAVPPA